MCTVLVLAAAIMGWQLFIPPIVGLADQGDFVRVLGPLGYAPNPKGPEHKYEYVTREFIPDPNYREPRWEQPSSEIIFAATAVRVHRVLASSPQFDITLIGSVHA